MACHLMILKSIPLENLNLFFQELSKDSPASRQLAIWRAVVVLGILLLEYFTLIFNSKDSPGAYENHPGNKAIRRAI